LTEPPAPRGSEASTARVLARREPPDFFPQPSTPALVTDNLDREYRKRIVELWAEKLPIRTARGPSIERMQHMKNVA
jgi:hypothetical protein